MGEWYHRDVLVDLLTTQWPYCVQFSEAPLALKRVKIACSGSDDKSLREHLLHVTHYAGLGSSMFSSSTRYADKSTCLYQHAMLAGRLGWKKSMKLSVCYKDVGFSYQCGSFCNNLLCFVACAASAHVAYSLCMSN